jgi:hypothetical protein
LFSSSRSYLKQSAVGVGEVVLKLSSQRRKLTLISAKRR